MTVCEQQLLLFMLIPEYCGSTSAKTREQESAAQQTTAEQQSDNVAHALAGAGGGLLSMALTLVSAPVVQLAE